MPGDTECFAHSDRLAEKRAAARIAGGQNSARVVRLTKGLPPELGDVPGRLRSLMDRAERGELYARDAEAFCALTRMLLDCLKWSEERTKGAELEERLAVLEAAAPTAQERNARRAR